MQMPPSNGAPSVVDVATAPAFSPAVLFVAPPIAVYVSVVKLLIS